MQKQEILLLRYIRRKIQLFKNGKNNTGNCTRNTCDICMDIIFSRYKKEFYKNNKVYNQNKMNWKSKNIIEGVKKNGSAHHLFNYHEVRMKIVALFGKPKTDVEHEILGRRCKKVMDNMPVFILNKDMHEEHEAKLRGAIRGDAILVTILKAKLDKTRSTYQKKLNNLQKELDSR